MKRKLSRSDIQQLHDLGSMRDRGILTPEEFAHEKGLLLNQEQRTNAPVHPASRQWLPWIAAAAVALVVGIVAVATSPGVPAAHGVAEQAPSQTRG